MTDAGGPQGPNDIANTAARDAESVRRLERIANVGGLDRVRATLDNAPPVLDELGISADEARDMLNTPLNQLEAAGVRPTVLEAIVEIVGRPPLVVRGGVVEGKTTLGTDFPADVDMRITAVEPLLPSIGRIEFVNHDMEWGGTGWVVGEETAHLLIATNRHVAGIVARRTSSGAGVFMFAPGAARYGANIDFVEEVDAGPDSSALFKIEKFTYLADDAAADIAIGRIAKPGSDAHALRVLELDDGSDKELVAVVGYPARDSLRNDPTHMEAYFKGLYDVKRFSPGFLREAGGATILGHDCTTLGGNSGSPVISLDSGKVVGLHYAGRYQQGNSAVRAATLQAVLDGARPTAVPGTELAMPERPDGDHDAAHFAGREGYDPEFLQVAPVPLPVTPLAFPLTAPSDATAERPFELRYQNFGILYCGTRKTALLAALNLDGARSRPQKRGNDKWYSDGRLPEAVQLGKADYDHPEIDRGHLIRRAATNWGDSDEQAKRSNDDSFHYTVAAPQHAAFNRSTALWLGLENYILGNARTHGFKACVFTGPILSPDEDEPELKDTGAPIPLRYFKVVTMLAEEEGSGGILRLHTTAYVLSQVAAIQQMLNEQGLPESAEGFALGEFRTFQVRVSDLEAMSGYDFGPLRDADPLARRIAETDDESLMPRKVFSLEGYENIVM
ncbi:endonuclease G [Aliiruegeria haliotis]|uniref:Serine protease n=1 Tax=Aliiruegeria haliotis TaxID=1280846 RepID=A0A2T0RYL5_9RHOB|nr:DNA/RNA non-specific endonuclease [Aliiruegeria haliotis]PRY26123.1 endonuclease G [Aliiruegeria haliotis]